MAVIDAKTATGEALVVIHEAQLAIAEKAKAQDALLEKLVGATAEKAARTELDGLANAVKAVDDKIVNLIAEVNQKQAQLRGGAANDRASVRASIEAALKSQGLSAIQSAPGMRQISHKAITSFGHREGARLFDAPQAALTVLDLFPQLTATADLVSYSRETAHTNSAAVQANELDVKPESNIVYTPATVPVETIAHWITVSKQVLSDIGQLSNTISARMEFMLLLKLEAQLLNGTGTNQLIGIRPAATASTYTAVAGNTRIDLYRQMALQGDDTKLPVEAYIMSIFDWADTELVKDLNGNYIFGSPKIVAAPSLWGRRVVVSSELSADQAIAGNFSLATEFHAREDLTTTISTQDSDNFRRNAATILTEMRGASVLIRPGSLIKRDNFTIPA